MLPSGFPGYAGKILGTECAASQVVVRCCSAGQHSEIYRNEKQETNESRIDPNTFGCDASWPPMRKLLLQS